MALILKQESTGSVPTPDAGKTALFVDTSGQIGVKQPGGTTVVTGNITAVNLDGNVSNVLSGAGTWIAAGGGGGGSYGNSNVATFLASYGSNTITTTGNISIGNITTSGVITATGNITGGNLVTGGLITATGNITGGNLVTAGAVSATGRVFGLSAEMSGSANIGTNLSATGNITAGGNLSVSGRTNLGAVGNVTITGGTSGYVLSTNGSGTLSWVAQSGGGSANLEQVTTDILPMFDSVYDIGSNTHTWYDTYLSGNLNINGARLTATYPLLGGNAVFSTSDDIVFSGAVLADQLLFTNNIITPDATTAHQYWGDKGIVVVNGSLDATGGDFIGTPVVQTIVPVTGHNAGVQDTSTINFGTGFDQPPTCMAVQSDGKILFGGYFTTYKGSGLSNNYLVRINADGTLDTAFQSIIGSYGPNGVVNVIKLLADGSFIVGGTFTMAAGYTCNRIAKFRTNGTGENAFNDYVNAYGGFNGSVTTLAVSSNGVAVGGAFTSYQGSPTQYFVLISSTDSNPVGPRGRFNDQVSSVAVDSRNRIYCVGNFTNWNSGQYYCYGIARMTVDGFFDPTFDPGTGFSGQFPGAVAIQADDNIIVGGHFISYRSEPAQNIVRIRYTDAMRDATFDTSPGLAGYYVAVEDILIQSDGKIIVGGQFETYAGNNSRCLVRINSNGTYDSSFDVGSGFPYQVFAVAQYSADTIIASSAASTYNGATIGYIAAIWSTTVNSVSGSTPPTSGEAGFIRYNNDISAFQGYTGTSWELLERVTTPPTTLAATGTVDIDFSGSTLRTQGALTGNITYTGSNYVVGSSVTTKVTNGATERTLTFPTNWVFVGTKPTTLAASKTAILTVTSFGTTEAECVAAWSAQA